MPPTLLVRDTWRACSVTCAAVPANFLDQLLMFKMYNCPHCKSRQSINLAPQQETTLRFQARQMMQAEEAARQQQQQRAAATQLAAIQLAAAAASAQAAPQAGGAAQVGAGCRRLRADHLGCSSCRFLTATLPCPVLLLCRAPPPQLRCCRLRCRPWRRSKRRRRQRRRCAPRCRTRLLGRA